MKIYLDYIFLINFMFDFLLLLSVSIILRRNVKTKKIIYGAILGGLTIFALFIKMSNISLIILKFITSILMVVISFGFKNIKYTFKNVVYLYMSSMVLGGVLYFLNIEFSYNREGLIFYHNGFSINMIVLLILSPIIIKTYINQLLELKNNYANYYKIDIKYNNEIIKLNAFLDTGNLLVDPITKVPIIIAKESYFNNIDKYNLVPYSTINENSLIKCIRPDEIKINNQKIKKRIKIGLVKRINMEGIDCILNQSILEEIC